MIERHLAGLDVPVGQRDEICRELATHLEDRFVVLRQRLPDEEAEREAGKLLNESKAFVKEIGNLEKEERMNQRTQSLWVPGFVMLAAYTLLFVALVRWGAYASDLRLLFFGKVALLVVFGAVGAWWARSLGATPLQRALVGVAPGIMTIASFLIAFPVHAWKSGSFSTGVGGQGAALLLDGIVIPMAALIIGALPFLKGGVGKAEVKSRGLAGA